MCRNSHLSKFLFGLRNSLRFQPQLWFFKGPILLFASRHPVPCSYFTFQPFNLWIACFHSPQPWLVDALVWLMDPPSWLMGSYLRTECPPLLYVDTLHRRRPPWPKSCPLLRGCRHSVTGRCEGMETRILDPIWDDSERPSSSSCLPTLQITDCDYSRTGLLFLSSSTSLNHPQYWSQEHSSGQLPELQNLPPSQLPGELVHNRPPVSMKSRTLHDATHGKEPFCSLTTTKTHINNYLQMINMKSYLLYIFKNFFYCDKKHITWNLLFFTRF